jgi:hypothetical protein
MVLAAIAELGEMVCVAPDPDLGELMKTISAIVMLSGLLFAAPSHAQVQASNLIGNYVVTGPNPTASPMTGRDRWRSRWTRTARSS